MKIKKEQLQHIYESVENETLKATMRDWFPNLFELKLEEGRWYKTKGGMFNFSGTYDNNHYPNGYGLHIYF